MLLGALATFVGAREPFAAHALAPACVLVAATVAFAVEDRVAEGRAHPSWLADPASRLRGLVAGVVVCLAAVGVGLAEDERLLPRSRALHETCWAVGVAAGLFALLCVAAVVVAVGARGGAARRVGVVAFFGAVAFGAFATYSLGFHWKETVSLCWTGRSAPSLDARRRATQGGARARSVFSVLPDLVFHFTRECELAEADLAKVARGECPTDPLPGVPCRCGDEQLPATPAARPRSAWRGVRQLRARKIGEEEP